MTPSRSDVSSAQRPATNMKSTPSHDIAGVSEHTSNEGFGGSAPSPSAPLPALERQLLAWLEPTDQGPEVDWSSAPDAGYRLLTGYERILGHAYAELRTGLTSLEERYPDLRLHHYRFESARYEQLCNRLYGLVDKVMVWELNAARERGELRGATPYDRFDDFVERVCGPARIAHLLAKYPMLSRLVMETVTGWLEATFEFVERLARDLDEIKALLATSTTPTLVSTKPAGDIHEGRCVLVCTFEDGAQIVYKPRWMDLDLAFCDLVEWYNGLGVGRALRAPRVLHREGYGWCEFVANNPCRSREELHDFYRAQGELMALLYATAAIDIHHENVVASGPNPVVVDAETLIQPELQLRKTSGHDMSAHALAERKIRQSVASTGMLPAVVDTGRGRKSLLVGGIATPDSMSPLPTARWQDVGKDTMHLRRTHFPVPKAKNSPELEGEAVPVLAFLGDLKRGFREGYEAIGKHREELRGPSGPLSSERSFRVRAIVRVTSKYELLRREGSHPTLLRGAEARRAFFDKLWAATRKAPNFAAAVPGEHAALSAGSIPRFETSSKSRDLPVLGELAQGFFARSADEVLQAQLAGLSPRDLEQQEWLLNACFACALYNHDQTVCAEPLSLLREPSTSDPLQDWLLEAAQTVAERLATLAIDGDDDATWLGVQPTDPGVFEAVPLQDDLYDGLPGIALFLAYLAATTDNPDAQLLAERAVRCLDRRVSGLMALERPLGGFVGWGGLIYAYTHLAHLWNRDDLLVKAGTFAEHIAAGVASDKNLDVLSGAAGAIAALLVLHDAGGGPRALEVAELCGLHLVAHLPRLTAEQRGPQGWATGLTGFSHGAAGFGWAMLRLWQRTGTPELRVLGRTVIQEERLQYDAEAGNWPDRRWSSNTNRPRFSTQWCHGSPGIGLSRLTLIGLLEGRELWPDVDAAIASVLRDGLGQRSHCLCHGDLGNLELLHTAARLGALDPEVFREKLTETAQRMSRDGIGFGTPMHAESPGLMTGLSGVGYALLRFARPNSVPNVLVLDPPCQADGETRA